MMELFQSMESQYDWDSTAASIQVFQYMSIIVNRCLLFVTLASMFYGWKIHKKLLNGNKHISQCLICIFIRILLNVKSNITEDVSHPYIFALMVQSAFEIRLNQMSYVILKILLIKSTIIFPAKPAMRSATTYHNEYKSYLSIIT